MTESRDFGAGGHSGLPGRMSVAVTGEPWLLDIDAIVVSVGESFGLLAATVADHFPEAPFRSVPLSEVVPTRPGTVRLTESGGQAPAGPWLAVLATPHEAGTGALTIGSITSAAESAIATAAEAGAHAVGLPLFATGALGLDRKLVAAVEVPAALAAARRHGTHVVFFGYSESDASAVEAAAAGELPAPDSQRLDGRRVPPADLLGGVSADWVDPNGGIPLNRDRLGLAPYVSMVAAVVSDRGTPTPLSVGIFGEWGSGKSYFMAMLRSRIAELAASGHPGYCTEIAQIGFNAWHYADTNIWASLGDEIFRQLAGPEASPEDQRRDLRDRLAVRLDQRRELDALTRQARVTVAHLQEAVDAAGADRDVGIRELVRSLAESPQFAERVGAVWRRLGVKDDVDQARILADQLHGTVSDAQALRGLTRERHGRAALGVAVLALLAMITAMAFAPASPEVLVSGGGVFVTCTAFGLAAVARARSGLRALRGLAEDLRADLHRIRRADTKSAVARALDDLRQAEADQRVAEAQLNDAVSHIGALGRQLTELSPGRRLYSFLSARAGGDSYKGNLGLISVLRKDLEQLVALMRDWRAHPEQAEPSYRPIDRIVLYIDDLDRCSPRQVVEVLQAVHLLLALDLFVVVLGVDPRWLVRALASHYVGMLDTQDGDPADRSRVLPEDYLEKIINIPLLLPGLPAGSLRPLLSSLAAPAEAAEPIAPVNNASADSARGVEDASTYTALTVETGSEADLPRGPRPAAPSLRPLTKPELDLLASLNPLIGTPRKAKRLLNLYRMLRSTRDLSGASRFLGEDGEPGDYQAVVLLLGLITAQPRLLQQMLDTPPDPVHDIAGGLMSRPPETPWPDFVADLEVRGQGNRVVGSLQPESVPKWSRVHSTLLRLSPEVTLPDLAALQLWVPRIRRFSYVLGWAEGPHRDEDRRA